MIIIVLNGLRKPTLNSRLSCLHFSAKWCESITAPPHPSISPNWKIEKHLNVSEFLKITFLYFTAKKKKKKKKKII